MSSLRSLTNHTSLLEHRRMPKRRGGGGVREREEEGKEEEEKRREGRRERERNGRSKLCLIAPSCLTMLSVACVQEYIQNCL